MVKHALLIGLNYPTDDKLALKSSYNDLNLVQKYLITNETFDSKNITQLTDKAQPKLDLSASFFNIVKKIKELIAKTTGNDILFFYFTGHGTQIFDRNNDELDSADEAFLPSDYKKNLINDDLLFSMFQNCKANTTVLFDACHSASALDLKYTYTLSPFISINKLALGDSNNVICFSACKDQAKTFASVLPSGQRNVKWYSNYTYYFIKHLANMKDKLSNKDLIDSIRNDQKKTCINKSCVSFSSKKLLPCLFLEYYDEKVYQITKNDLSTFSEKTQLLKLKKINLKQEKEINMMKNIIERYKNAFYLKDTKTIDNFNAILYSIKN